MNNAFSEMFEAVQTHAQRGDPDDVIAAIDRFTRGKGLMHIGAHKGQVLDRAANKPGVCRILELGSYFGYSAVRMARHLPADGVLVTVDADVDHHRAAAWLVDYAGLSDRVRLLHGRASEIIDTLDDAFDVVFIDHYASNYLADLSLIEAAELVQPGAIVLTDNVVIFASSLGPYLHHVRVGGRYRSELHRFGGDGVEVSAFQG